MLIITPSKSFRVILWLRSEFCVSYQALKIQMGNCMCSFHYKLTCFWSIFPYLYPLKTPKNFEDFVSINMTKLAVSWRFGHIYWINSYGFLVFSGDINLATLTRNKLTHQILKKNIELLELDISGKNSTWTVQFLVFVSASPGKITTDDYASQNTKMTVAEKIYFI